MNRQFLVLEHPFWPSQPFADVPATLSFTEIMRVYPVLLGSEIGRYVVIAGFVSLLIWLLWRPVFAARKLQTRRATRADYQRDILLSLRTVFIFSLVGTLVYVGARTGFYTLYTDFSVRGAGYMLGTWALMVIAHDTWFYWTHRAMHHPRLFRHFHRAHHRAHTPTPWTAYAFDIPEAIVMLAFVPLFLLFVPLHVFTLGLFMLFQIIRNVMGHAGVELSPVSGRPSRLWGWLNTTTHHDLHHAQARYNFGLYFTFWDRVMGTEHPEYQARLAALTQRPGARTYRRVISLAGLAGVAAALALGLAARAEASPAAAVAIDGRWATPGIGALIDIAPCAEGAPARCGTLVWLWEDGDAAGRALRDHKNPDATLRARPLIGIRMIDGLSATAPGVFVGTLYNFEDGRTYRGEIRRVGDVLVLKGCAARIFCVEQVWREAAEVRAALERPATP